MKKITTFLAALAISGSAASVQATTVPNPLADIVFVVDESGSMGGEHSWLAGMTAALNTALTNAGVTNALYSLVGFGRSGGGAPRTISNSVTANNVNFGGLVTSGSFEDGYAGLDHAFDNLTFRSGAARNYILVTDEDRDVFDNSLNYSNILAALTKQNALLNAVVDNRFGCGTVPALGRTATSGYQVDGSGGFTTCTNPTTGSGDGNTANDYVAMALATGGAAWNLNVLRNGGNDALSFTNSFIDIKVREIVNQPPSGPVIPLPAAAWLLMGGLGALGAMGARRRKAA